jgi:hypothetical protein
MGGGAVAGGHAAICCYSAAQALHAKRTSVAAPGEDFRLLSSPLDLETDALFFSLIRNFGLSAASSGYRAFPVGLTPLHTNPPLNIRLGWLTPCDHAIKHVETLGSASLESMISGLANWLGLAVPEVSVRWTLRVFRSVAPGSLFRPHALSGVLGHRFSAISEHEPFGTTIRSTTGEFGMPECIGRQVDLEDVTDTPEGASRISQLFQRNGLGSPPKSVIAEVYRSAVEPVDGYPRFQQRVMSRLGISSRCSPSDCECVL